MIERSATPEPGDATGTAVLVVDVQRDFCSGGALAVPGGDRVVPVLNRMLTHARLAGLPVYASRDWHPTVSSHFTTGGGPWPVHCVAGTDGARFHRDLHLPEDARILGTGLEPDSDGYSAFDGHLDDGVSLAADLHRLGVAHLIVGGLATDYCVRHSVLDAIQQGWRVTLVTDAVAAVELTPGDGKRALAEMRDAGADLRQSADLDLRV